MSSAKNIVKLIGNIANRPDLRAIQDEQIRKIDELVADTRNKTIEECAALIEQRISTGRTIGLTYYVRAMKSGATK